MIFPPFLPLRLATLKDSDFVDSYIDERFLYRCGEGEGLLCCSRRLLPEGGQVLTAVPGTGAGAVLVDGGCASDTRRSSESAVRA